MRTHWNETTIVGAARGETT